MARKGRYGQGALTRARRFRAGGAVAALLLAAALGMASLAVPALRDAASNAASGEKDQLLGVEELLDSAASGSTADGVAVSGDVSSWESELAVAEAAEEVLADYGARSGCALAQSGWLDFSGSTWGCVAFGEGWSEVCVVQEGQQGGSVVGRLRMDASSAELATDSDADVSMDGGGS